MTGQLVPLFDFLDVIVAERHARDLHRPDLVYRVQVPKRDLDDEAPTLDEAFAAMAAMEGEEVAIEETEEGEVAEPSTPEPEPTPPPPADKPGRKVFDPKKVDPKTVAVKWEPWSVGVKCPEEDKIGLARQVLVRLRNGEKEAMAVHADCVIFGCATSEGFFIYDCTVKRRASVT